MRIACNNYSILINELARINELVVGMGYSKVMVLVDKNTKKHCLPYFLSKVKFPIIEVILPDGETSKTLDTTEKIWDLMAKHKLDRHSLCINLGGGVIGDMGGFAASSYMRGIDFVQIPTTLLSQVDSSVGGKLGIDYKGYKNLIGLIQNPKAVFIETEFLKTLAERQLKSGFAEVIKHALIRNSNAYYRFAITDMESMNWEEIIAESVQIKQKITDEDPREKGIRKILNFGHTFGHAIESYHLGKETELLHGEAIAIGMVMESYLSTLLPDAGIERTEVDLIKTHITDIYGHLPNHIPSLEDLLPYLKMDKKNKDGVINFSLLRKVGDGIYNQEVSEEMMREAMEYYIS